MSETYILCEGYHDRAFWAGMLAAAGCTDPGERPDGTRIKVLDPWGRSVEAGHFAYRTRSGGFIRIVPAKSRSLILEAARQRLHLRQQQRLHRLVIHADCDENADGTPGPHGEMQINTILELARSFDPKAAVAAHSDAEVLVDAGATRITLLRWKALDAPAEGLPNQQTLERLLCAAIRAAYPERGAPVHQWLASRPSPPPADAKEHAWSYLAGWYANHGSYEAFCRLLWRDDRIATTLRERLEKTGVWSVVESIAS